jgi:NADH-quinone oxidoreductase subunit J
MIFILLIAIIAAITLVHKNEGNRKSQNIAEQVSVKAKDRVRLVSIVTPDKGGKS